MKNNDYVTASEIAEYVYCKRAWWLRLNGKLPKTPRMLQGIREHEKLNYDLHVFDRKKIVASLLIGIGLTIIILYYLVTLLLL